MDDAKEAKLLDSCRKSLDRIQGGQVARARFDAYGVGPREVRDTLLRVAGFVDDGLQAQECSYGECVIERNLSEQDGTAYAWKGRLTIHPSIGRDPFVPVGRLVDGISS